MFELIDEDNTSAIVFVINTGVDVGEIDFKEMNDMLESGDICVVTAVSSEGNDRGTTASQHACEFLYSSIENPTKVRGIIATITYGNDSLKATEYSQVARIIEGSLGQHTDTVSLAVHSIPSIKSELKVSILCYGQIQLVHA
jgi:uncharacterized protein YwlG (UPF0340 family)